MTAGEELGPGFMRGFRVEAVEQTAIRIRHRAAGHWWRFEVVEKNGRRQLLHAGHGTGPTSTDDVGALGVDAYDTATREARRRGMVD